MRWLRLAAPAVVLAAWLAGSFAQQGPPAGTPPPGTPPAGTPPATRPPPAPVEEEPEPPPRADSEDVDDSFDPTEELPPDAAVTFPVDI